MIFKALDFFSTNLSPSINAISILNKIKITINEKKKKKSGIVPLALKSEMNIYEMARKKVCLNV